jgi:hypothetical protein
MEVLDMSGGLTETVRNNHDDGNETGYDDVQLPSTRIFAKS